MLEGQILKSPPSIVFSSYSNNFFACRKNFSSQIVLYVNLSDFTGFPLGAYMDATLNPLFSIFIHPSI